MLARPRERPDRGESYEHRWETRLPAHRWFEAPRASKVTLHTNDFRPLYGLWRSCRRLVFTRVAIGGREGSASLRGKSGGIAVTLAPRRTDGTGG
ncbi:hypothetical protein AAFF_G00132830 [Aldrovandia affinis]|uniref:Uncharacterized protein n=1 Tax=Aldrovandia affinis TaxID=143900 RepID=A0AAD7RQL5_9TELE|nr:hypothetical protein AAFF_G00132830 [Aldrovandia affinis]